MSWKFVDNPGADDKPTSRHGPEDGMSTDADAFKFDLGGALDRLTVVSSDLPGDESDVDRTVVDEVTGDGVARDGAGVTEAHAGHNAGEDSVQSTGAGPRTSTPVELDASDDVGSPRPFPIRSRRAASGSPDGDQPDSHAGEALGVPLPAPASPSSPTAKLGAASQRDVFATTEFAPPVPSLPEAGQVRDVLPRRSRSDDPAVEPGAAPLPSRSDSAPALDRLPRRESGSSEPDSADPSPPRPPTRRIDEPRRSVFDAPTPAPTLAATPSSPDLAPPQRPNIPPAIAQTLPQLPTASPLVAPISIESAASPVGPDLQAVRSYQRRIQREARQSKIAGHSFLVLFVLAGLIGAALVFGRSLLFPEQWDAELTPIVDEIQVLTGEEFSEVVPVRELGDHEYAAIALSVVLGDDWQAGLEEWRALGIATGEGDSAGVAAAAVALRPAVYDPVSNTIYRAAGADPEMLPIAYEIALLEIFNRQHATPPNGGAGGTPNVVLGVHSTREINSQALDRVLSGSAPAPWALPAETTAPLPVLYELAAIDRLGDSLRAVDTETVLRYGDVYPDAVLDAASRPTRLATGGAIPEGAESLAPPVALGNDAWSLVWGNRLPAATVDRLGGLIVGDSYRPLAWVGRACVVANFRTVSEEATADVVAGLSRWTLGAPASAEAKVAAVGPTLVQMTVCDPGPVIEQELDPAVVETAIARQVAALDLAADG